MKIQPEEKPLRLLLAALLLAVFPLANWLAGETRSQNPAGRTAAAGVPGQYNGPGSCSSTSCHGSLTPVDGSRILQNEFSTWVAKDKHSKAYRVLTEDLGVQMARILHLEKGAENSPKCLACHALYVADEKKRARTFGQSEQEGVSCESCHGPAAGWLGEHTARDWPHDRSVAAGMYDTRDLIKRAEKCLSCHVGSQEKFVDHEMIAAGHPDLLFELDTFSTVMPRHWKEPREKAPGVPERKDPLYGVRDLAVGQAVQLQSALRRLADRARDKGKLWPEYSELQCSACHHSLTNPENSWRQKRGYPGRRAGDPPWNAARYAVFRILVREADPQAEERLTTDLKRLSELMSRVNSDRDAVVAAAGNCAGLAENLAPRMVTWSYDRPRTLRLLQQISADADFIASQGEGAAAQATMALQSLFTAYNNAPDNKPGNAQELREAIRGLFPLVENPSAYDERQFAVQMRKVNSLLR